MCGPDLQAFEIVVSSSICITLPLFPYKTSINIGWIFFQVLPSVGLGALSAREAEGRTNISAGEKVLEFLLFYENLSSFLHTIYHYNV
ncbi:hypothetical protein Leryth_009675 [Lithospermum erythrorhizon]|nr:hypothetical protein Leryth_009675 [Lithospermum erythrorhizon]